MAERTVLVTGGTGGLGGAVTAAFLEAGWRVVVPGRAGGGTAPAAGPVPAGRQPQPGAPDAAPRPEAVTADLLDPDGVARAVAVATGEPAAPLRAVVNLVGGYASGGLVHETPIEEFDRMLRLNLRPTYLVTQAALPHLLAAGGGAVVCVAARAAVAPFPGAAGYVTAKAAVQAFSNAVAVEYRQRGVRSNTVLPSVIDTPANRAAQPDADHRRWVPPAEIAAVIRFLASDESAPTSGASIPVYGRA
ncbi:SDR family NAD(P)-dependent oxidoreductase [Micromonospora halotolerans]|uniref:SDR family NAD(P)-dependent oxidoreductase n=1 Tax=Micromonospora halotolerans TaxID=709879 RepID=A0ABY9ZP51_9ACTN|nr:SDR family NAD(P)-dependent oxidoreductase [Micromonospora halotolerans]WNM37004.1 SDR family NAD(P)-dependent oxidoreductase [Micromonospora halotolerans]